MKSDLLFNRLRLSSGLLSEAFVVMPQVQAMLQV
jgi:hypothetical protein